MYGTLKRRGLKSAYEDLESASSSSKNGEQGQQQPEQQKVEGEPFFTTFKTRLGFFKNGTSKRVSDYIMYSAHRGAKIVSRVEPQQDGFGEGGRGVTRAEDATERSLVLEIAIEF